MARRSLPAAAVLAFIFLVAAAAQTPQRPSTLRVNTQLVEVSVVVKDSQGNPVPGLKQDDFELYDRDKRQEIKIFQAEDYRQGAVAPTPPPPLMLAAPHTYSNRVQIEPGALNPPTVVVIDAGSTWDTNRMTWQDLVYARDQLVQFLRQVRPEDRLGFYLMGPHQFWILREYNQSCADLLERLATWKTPAEAPAASKAADAWAEFAIHFLGTDPETAKAIHRAQFWYTTATAVGPIPPEWRDGFLVAPSLSLLEAVASHLASVPGRKNVILISGTMFLPKEFKDQVASLRNIIQAGVTVYAIDPGGLAPYALDASFVIPSKVTASVPSGQESRAAQAYVQKGEDSKRQTMLALHSSLTEIAESTGGKAFLDTNDIKGAVRGAFDDSRVSYTLGFYAADLRNDGSYHPLKVKLPGRENLAVHCRDGYFEPESPQREVQRRDTELRQAVWSPADATGIQLSGTLSPAAGPNDYDLQVYIGLAGLNLLQDGDLWNGQLDVTLFARDNSGNAWHSVSDTLRLNLREGGLDMWLRTGYPYSRNVRLIPQATALRVIVRDANSRNLGSLTIPVPGAPGL